VAVERARAALRAAVLADMLAYLLLERGLGHAEAARLVRTNLRIVGREIYVFDNAPALAVNDFVLLPALATVFANSISRPKDWRKSSLDSFLVLEQCVFNVDVPEFPGIVEKCLTLGWKSSAPPASRTPPPGGPSEPPSSSAPSSAP
jgi:hypothetical protein